ncbi:MAG: NADH-quinone oxidoreductase subunit NuoK [Saprospiraceae bacterium]|jgi:NADH-quinone oxidoreductase subunit K|nr:NADH-quinone oxidoreductase subunit NuoK [Saprospiraceae bacterium]MCA0333051.1 NADH-quinone oxidoreductase subunit NuoK [Bacteroidota bacterium]MCB0603352.1 NADH-quinone oxidoreductase subunit NuoK [Saprospiraceae bacterium]MCO5276598.1 NADH-quinone oxidoreductase subunit NuoK [Saprospiraceae bacterium]HMT76140.1 NADH-quinone oxidoreductase subunit NuoK [Saprospiraceae bacterium]
MSDFPLNAGLILSGILFLTGLLGVITRRNILFTLMSVEIMFNAAGLAFVLAGAQHGKADGQVMLIFILAMAAAEVAVGLALILQMHRLQKTVDTDAMNQLRD